MKTKKILLGFTVCLSFMYNFWNAKVKPKWNIEPWKTSNNPFDCN